MYVRVLKSFQPRTTHLGSEKEKKNKENQTKLPPPGLEPGKKSKAFVIIAIHKPESLSRKDGA